MIGTVSAWSPGRKFGFVKTGGPGIDRRAPDFIFLPSSLLSAVTCGDEVDFWLGEIEEQSGRRMAVDVAKRGVEAARIVRLFVGNVPSRVGSGRLWRAIDESGVRVVQIFWQEGWNYAFVDFTSEDSKRALSGEVRVEVDGLELRFTKCR